MAKVKEDKKIIKQTKQQKEVQEKIAIQKQPQKKVASRKPRAIQRFFKETIGELRKVSWPTWPEARRLTTIVLIVVAGMALFLGLFDILFSQLIGLIVGL